MQNQVVAVSLSFQTVLFFSYKTGHLDKRGYDDYMTSTAIDKYSTSEMQNIRLNMYVAAEQKYEDVK